MIRTTLDLGAEHGTGEEALEWRIKARSAEERAREWCARIIRGKRFLQEAYSDPGRVRDPKPRNGLAIALLWETERELLGRDPEAYERFEPPIAELA